MRQHFSQPLAALLLISCMMICLVAPLCDDGSDHRGDDTGSAIESLFDLIPVLPVELPAAEAPNLVAVDRPYFLDQLPACDGYAGNIFHPPITRSGKIIHAI